MLYEWEKIAEGLSARSDIRWRVKRTNAEGLPVSYLVDYQIRSICSVTDVERLGQKGVENKPLYADHFRMIIELPDAFPCVDGHRCTGS